MDTSNPLIKGTVVPVILKLLSEREMYGYEIIKEVNRRTNNVFAYKEGTLYPWLHQLAGDGLVESEWVEADNKRQRKYYRITRQGLAVLKDKTAEWTVVSHAVNALLLAGA
ncbi:MAG: helix-turn-helix transcriptional regulator [Lentisphaeria bacterium]